MSASSPRKPTVKRFPAAKQRRMDLLLERNNSGTIGEDERAELEALVAEAEALMVGNAKRLADFAETHRGSGAPRATPVTVWVAGAPGAP